MKMKTIAGSAMIAFFICMMGASQAYAGTLNPFAYHADNYGAGANTNYTFSFRNETALSDTDFTIYAWYPTDFSIPSFDTSDAVVTVNGAPKTVTTANALVAAGHQLVYVGIGEAIATSSNITVQIQGVINPAATGTYNFDNLYTSDGFGTPIDFPASVDPIIINSSDTTSPSATGLEAKTLLNETDALGTVYRVAVNYDEPMDESVLPEISYSPAPARLQTGNCGGHWESSTQFVFPCNLYDDNEEIPDISIQIVGAKDLAGNTQNVANFADYFSLDTVAPTFSGATIGGRNNIALHFSEPVSTSVSNIGNFSGALSGHTVIGLIDNHSDSPAFQFDEPLWGLDAEGQFDIGADEITDEAGNSFPGGTGYSALDRQAPTITYSNLNSTGISCSGSGGTCIYGDSVRFTWDSSAEAVLSPDIGSVHADLRHFDGPADVALVDDGTGGDLVVGDGIYSATLTLVPGTVSGTPFFTVFAYDTNGNQSNTIASDSGVTVNTNVPAQSEVWVDDDYNSGSAGGHTWSINAFDNIADAVGAVAASGTVHVASGTYEISNPITLNLNSMRIVGPGIGEGVDRAIIRNTECATDRAIVFDVHASNVRLQGLQIEQSDGDYCNIYPVIRVWSHVASTTITDNDIAGGEVGVALRYDSVSSTVSHNAIHDNSDGVVVNGTAGNDINNNDVYSNSYGLSIGCGNDGDSCDSSGSVISSNSIHDNTSVGISFGAGDQRDAVTVGPNNVINNNGEGIRVSGSAHNFIINHNQIYGNSMPRTALNVENAATGLDARQNWWGDATGPNESVANPNGNGDYITITDSNFVMYRPFYTNSGMTELSQAGINPGGLIGLFGSGTFVLPEGENHTSVHSVEVAEETAISFPTGSGTTTITLPGGTVITKAGGGTFDAYDMTAANVALSALSGFSSGHAVGAMQWGIPSLGLVFSTPITINMYVGTEYNGQTLTLSRSLSTGSGWTSDGIVAPGTCLVASGICSFQTTKASYFVASAPGSGGSTGGGGGTSVVAIAPRALISGQKLDFLINHGENTTDSNVLALTLNADPSVVSGYSASINANFTGASIEKYGKTVIYNLPENDGKYTVYLKYFSSMGNSSEIISHAIELKNFKPGAVTQTSGTIVAPTILTGYIFKRNLQVGAKGADVKQLQIFLNNQGYKVANVGAGSPGKESTVFGMATKKALIKFQEKYSAQILKPFGLKKGTGNFMASTRKFVNNMLVK